MAIPTKGPDGYKFNPFTAIEMGDPKHGAQGNSEDEVIKQLTKDIAAGWSINTIDKYGGTFLIDTASRGMSKTCLWLIEQGIDVTPKDDEYQRTALQWAANTGLIAVVKLLHNKGLPIDEKDKQGFTALLLACAGAKDSEAFEMLDIKQCDSKGKLVTKGGVAEQVAKDQQGYIDTLQYLLDQGANPNTATTMKGHAGLHYAADGHLYPLATVLLQHKATIDPVAKEAGIIPLHFAARHGDTSLVKLFLEHNANPNYQDEYGFTPLHEAVHGGHTETVKALLDAGADPTIQVTKGFKPYLNHENAIDMAKHQKHTAIIALLHPTTTPTPQKKTPLQRKKKGA